MVLTKVGSLCPCCCLKLHFYPEGLVLSDSISSRPLLVTHLHMSESSVNIHSPLPEGNFLFFFALFVVDDICLSSVHLGKEHTDTHSTLPHNTAGSLSAFNLVFFGSLKELAMKLSAHKWMIERQAGETAIKNLSLLGMCSLCDDVLLAGSIFMAVSGLYKHIKLWLIQENRISRLNAFCWWN